MRPDNWFPFYFIPCRETEREPLSVFPLLALGNYSLYMSDDCVNMLFLFVFVVSESF